MFQKRMLLLGASLVAFGAITIGGALAFSTYFDQENIGPTSVVQPDNSAVLDPIGASSEVADNTYKLISTISSSESDSNYNYALKKLEITSQGSGGSFCGPYDYAMDGPVTVVNGSPNIGPVVSGSGVQSGYSVYVRINPVGTTTCVITGGVLEATYEAGA